MFNQTLTMCGAWLTLAIVQIATAASPDEVILQNGLPVANLSGGSSSEATFRISIPAGAQNLVIRTSRGDGDCDLYVKFGAVPTEGDFDQRSARDGAKESLTIPAPSEGDWHVMLFRFKAFKRVKLVASYELGDHRVATPVLLPGPGIYRGPATVRITCATPGAHLHYTINGDTPLGSSPLVPGPLTITSDTIVKARAFKSGLTESGVATGEYFIKPAAEISTLEDGVPIVNLAGMDGTDARFKIVVPPGQKRLVVQTSGGSGNCDLIVSRAAQPKRSARAQTLERIVIAKPAAGIWSIRLHARGNYRGVSLTATYQNNLPDLIAWPGALNPFLSTETFSQEDCDVVEGAVQAGTRRLLRFNTESRNIGDRDLVMGHPEDHPELFEYHECHGHFHFNGFASYRLLDAEGHEVALGRKVSFCLEDIERWDKSARRRSRFTCEDQGIQAGWADVYDASLSGQWIDVTGVPPGAYTLEITMDPDRLLPEANYDNNTTRARIQIDPPPVPVDLTNGAPLTNLSGEEGSEKLYRVAVPSGTAALEVKMSGGRGDGDLFVKFGAAPNTSDFDSSSESAGNEENVSVPNPAAGDWYILISGFSSYRGVSLRATAQ